jgi:hypothetical protein
MAQPHVEMTALGGRKRQAVGKHAVLVQHGSLDFTQT